MRSRRFNPHKVRIGNFSIDTLTTAGYGTMSPASLVGRVVASIEILTRMVGVALITGLVFARFAKPAACFVVRDNGAVRDFEAKRVLMLRVANERYNRILDAVPNFFRYSLP